MTEASALENSQATGPERHDLARAVFDRLARRYPRPSTQLNWKNPWELLVATILSAQCTDVRVNKITPDFFSRWPEPIDLLNADLKEIEKIIYSAGFYRNKAKNLQETARLLVEKHQGFIPSSMDELVTLPGVARKTANVVLSNAFGIQEGIAVDTHVARISQRLGLTDFSNPTKIEKELMEVFPQKEWGNMNHRLVLFGRDVCRAKNPQCERCELAQFCSFYF
ncbi:MAG: endonuclease III [Deltaproteobacteria bacterium]|nr:endonuclease III [Deltaproteobacteria bacterium]